jgi:uncharacterized protein (TIGR02145 family)
MTSDPIPNVTDDSQWNSLSNGAWCHYENSVQNENVYGKLYNWFAVDDVRNVCPFGWHVLSDEEWLLLEGHLGSQAGNKMKRMTIWSNSVGGSNTSGFNGHPGGYRDDDGFLAIWVA